MADKYYEVYVISGTDKWVEFSSSDLEVAREKATETWNSLTHSPKHKVLIEIREYEGEINADNSFGDSLADEGYKFKLVARF